MQIGDFMQILTQEEYADHARLHKEREALAG